MKDPATKQFQADLKKYAKVTGVPDFGQYSGDEIGDFTGGQPVEGRQPADPSGPHRRLRTASVGYDRGRARVRGPSTSASPARGKTPPTTCGYFVQVKNGKFVPYPKNGKPITGKLVGTPEALAAAKAGTAATPTTVAPTTAAP